MSLDEKAVDSLHAEPWLPLCPSELSREADSTRGGSVVRPQQLFRKIRFDSDGYVILLTDLMHLWTERVDAPLLRKKREELVPSFVGTNAEFLDMLKGYLSLETTAVTFSLSSRRVGSGICLEMIADTGSFVRVRWVFDCDSLINPSGQDGSADNHAGLEIQMQHLTGPMVHIAAEYRRRFLQTLRMLEDRERDMIELQAILKTHNISYRRKLMADLKSFDVEAADNASEEILAKRASKSSGNRVDMAELFSDERGKRFYAKATAPRVFQAAKVSRSHQNDEVIDYHVISSGSSAGASATPAGILVDSTQSSCGPLPDLTMGDANATMTPATVASETPEEREQKRRLELMEKLESEKQKKDAGKKKKRIF